MSIGILALQGDFAAHADALARLGAETSLMKTAEDVLAAGRSLPGGESTTMWKLMEGTGIPEALVDAARAGKPVYGTCAGAILLAHTVTNPDGQGLGVLDATVQRNAYGRQLDSTVLTLTDVNARVLGDAPMEAVFIRAPRFAAVGPAVEVLARRDGHPVLVRQGNILAATFHPELTGDDRVAKLFLESVAGASRKVAA
jgi:5'-phosphate synthase pdxT subunit